MMSNTEKILSLVNSQQSTDGREMLSIVVVIGTIGWFIVVVVVQSDAMYGVAYVVIVVVEWWVVVSGILGVGGVWVGVSVGMWVIITSEIQGFKHFGGCGTVGGIV